MPADPWKPIVDVDITVDSLTPEGLAIVSEHPIEWWPLMDKLVQYCEAASREGMEFDEWARNAGLVELDLFEGPDGA